jgi:quercetin dioxygenase-like cupin family protein
MTMPFIDGSESPEFRIPGVTFSGLASPSRGATENAVWRVRLDPESIGMTHQLTREETIVATRGRATALLDGVAYDLTVGSAVIVPPHMDFALSNPHAVAFEAVAVIPVGGQAYVPGAAPFTPPWAE